MKSSKKKDLLTILFIYLLAFTIAAIVFINLKYSVLMNIFIADVVATIIVFIFSMIYKNSSIYDPYWSVAPSLIGIPLIIYYQKYNFVIILLTAIILIWNIRLTFNWAYKFKGMSHQDFRYTDIANKTKKLWPLVSFLGIHLFPTVMVFMCMAPYFHLLTITELSINLFVVVGMIVCILGISLEFFADKQLVTFIQNNNIKGSICKDGLWKYSRHPNYLGEILMWWGLFIACCSFVPFYFVIGALANNLMFLFISIPMMEKHLNITRNNYDEYKKEARMLLPIKK